MIALLVGVLVVMIAIAGIRHLHVKREGKAFSELTAATGEIDAAAKLEKLKGLAAKYGNAGAGDFILLAEAQARFESRDYEGALATVRSEALVGNASPALANRARLLEAAAAEGLGRFDQARRTYTDMVARGEVFFAQVAQNRLDALEEMMGDASRAAADLMKSPTEKNGNARASTPPPDEMNSAPLEAAAGVGPSEHSETPEGTAEDAPGEGPAGETATEPDKEE